LSILLLRVEVVVGLGLVVMAQVVEVVLVV
jgi:hypothetical protein